MFSKFHHQPPPQNFHPPLFPPSHHLFSHQLTKETSQEADSATPPPTTAAADPPPPSSKKPKPSAANDADAGETIEIFRRPRGRPPGSKNRPKPSVVITQDPNPSMSPYILEVAGGVDIVESVTRYTRSRNVGLCVLAASGAVLDVTLKQPFTSATVPGSIFTYPGRFEILSLSAVVAAVGYGNNDGVFSVSFPGPQGQVVGGKVAGPLVASGTVYVIAASFDRPSYHRLPMENNEDVRRSISGGDEGRDNESGGGAGVENGKPASGGGGGAMLGTFSLGSDVHWGPAAGAGRRPPPPY